MYFANSTYETYLQQGLYPSKICIVSNNKARLDEIIPGVTISNGKYDCTELIKELKSIKEKINYRDFASNEVNYSFFKKQLDLTYDSAIDLVKYIFMLKLPIIEPYEDYKAKLSKLKY